MKAALYIRVSTHFQIDKDSLPFQRQELINYSKYVLGNDNYQIFEDAGYSAKNTDRPSYQAMMSRIRSGEFTHLIVWKIDRVSRNLLDFSSMYEELKKYNVTFISKNEQFDTSSAMGEAMLKIILVFAELERKLTAERVTSIMLSRAEKGLWNGATVPLGYKWSDEIKFPVIDENEASTVRLIYDLYLKLRSTTKIAQHLNTNHIPTKRNGTWVAKTVNDILRNPFYIGTYRYNMKDQKRRLKKEDEWIIIEDNHEGIIDKPTFKQVQRILEDNYNGNSQYQRENIHTHIFSSLVYCSKCGTRFWAGLDSPRKKDGYRPSRYVCYKNNNGCQNIISDVTLLPFILNFIANFIRLNHSTLNNLSLKSIEKTLLRGKAFVDVIGIDHFALESTFKRMATGLHDELELNSDTATESKVIQTDEMESLEKEKKKYEKALERLESLYLFSEDSMSQKDFIFKQRDLKQHLEQVNAKLAALNIPQAKDNLADLSWLDDIQYFILMDKIQNTIGIDYREILNLIDIEVLKEFISKIVEEIHVQDKKVMSLKLSNGITYKFAYKEHTQIPTREHLLYRKYEDTLLELLKTKIQVTRKDVEEAVPLGRVTIGKLINEFIERGIIVRCGASTATYYTLVENKDLPREIL
ncbi:recombinase family protein [Niameybacter massiliensis]|uniref:Recombinase family protein n=1 Tax=Holtiella tumoricola TaxID=3018743 RepID=A0AA42DQZ2_9FIRM|nr:recombinase family protein [Holtiella tumoricola]MDA3733615.1 recombinase family protein [Holtiella tumoricola]